MCTESVYLFDFIWISCLNFILLRINYFFLPWIGPNCVYRIEFRFMYVTINEWSQSWTKTYFCENKCCPNRLFKHMSSFQLICIIWKKVNFNGWGLTAITDVCRYSKVILSNCSYHVLSITFGPIKSPYTNIYANGCDGTISTNQFN